MKTVSEKQNQKYLYEFERKLVTLLEKYKVDIIVEEDQSLFIKRKNLVRAFPDWTDKKFYQILQIIKFVEDGDITAPNDKLLSEHICDEIKEIINK